MKQIEKSGDVDEREIKRTEKNIAIHTALQRHRTHDGIGYSEWQNNIQHFSTIFFPSSSS